MIDLFLQSVDRRWVWWLEDGVGSRLSPTMVEDLLHHPMRGVRSRHLVFRYASGGCRLVCRQSLACR